MFKEQMNKIKHLPKELCNLICLFAWNVSRQETLLSAALAAEVNTWDIHRIFVRNHHFDWSFMGFRASPLFVCAPNIPPDEWFRLDIAFTMLQMLDFRRKEVRVEGNRYSWTGRLHRNWEAIKPFSDYYIRMITNESNWRVFGFNQVKSLQFYGADGLNEHHYFFLEP